jgi:endonuclease V-like protein UPF0215 family
LSCKRFRIVKPEIRVLGIDDGVFTPHATGSAIIVGVVFRGGYWLDGVMHTKVKVDGLDGTRKIASMIVNSPHYKQLRVIMLNGVTCAGFNVVNIKELSAETKLPVIAVTREKPNFVEIRRALRNLPRPEERWSAIRGTGGLLEVCTRRRGARVYMQIAGICEEDARKILQMTSTRSSIPEALRVAHLIASGITAKSI